MSVNRSLTIGIKEKAKHVRITGTATQFQGSTPANITLQAKLYGITAKSYAWYKGASAVVGTNPNFVIANNQIKTVETYKVVVTAIDGQVYEDTLSVTKVQNGATGKSGKIIVQREWIVGDVYRNNSELIDYIYHRVTDSWWKLRVGFDNVTAAINPGSQFEKVTSMEELALGNIIAEGGNIAGFIFKDGKMLSQAPNTENANLILDGVAGKLVANDASIKGHINASSGYFGGFKIQSGKIISDNNQLEINGSNATITMKHSNGVSGIVQGIDGSGAPTLKFFDNKGNLVWEAGTLGIMYVNNIPESYTSDIYYKVSNSTGNGDESMLRRGMDMYYKKVIYYNLSRGSYDTKVTLDNINKEVPESRGYKYFAGNNPESSLNAKYEGFIYSEQSKYGSKLSSGWYYQSGDLEGMYTYYDNDYPSRTIKKTQRLFKIENGKITASVVWNVVIEISVYPVDPVNGSVREKLEYTIGSQIS